MKRLLLILLFFAVGLSASAQAPKTKADSLKAAAVVKAKADSVNTAKKAALDAKIKPDQAAKAPVPGKTDTSDADTVRQWAGWILIILIIGLFFYLTWESDLLRAPIINAADFMTAAAATVKYKDVSDINKIPKPFSLARSQLAVWTVVIGCSYLYMELCKCSGVPATGIDKTLLGLMGISAATAAAGNVIDNNATPDQQGAPSPSEGFFKDIMSDQNGINIHRFQNVVWTLIAVTLYLSQLPEVLCGHLPTLDATLVSLTAISSATYLGLKINENTPPAIPPTTKTS